MTSGASELWFLASAQPVKANPMSSRTGSTKCEIDDSISSLFDGIGWSRSDSSCHGAPPAHQRTQPSLDAGGNAGSAMRRPAGGDGPPAVGS